MQEFIHPDNFDNEKIVRHCCEEHDRSHPGVQPSAVSALDALLVCRETVGQDPDHVSEEGDEDTRI